MSRERNLQILQASLLLPLTDTERGLLRTISHNYAMGTESSWGAENQKRAEEVRALFTKCALCFTD